MLDMGYQSGQSDPNWFDVLRPSKLPAYKNQYGEDGRFFAGVRQSRLGFKGFIRTDLGELRTIFEFELFGGGGGIIAVSPGKFGIAVVSPPLDEAGNSVRAQKAIADISNALGGNPYAPRMK